MKKKISSALSLILLLIVFSSATYSIDIFVKGNKLLMDVPPQIINSRIIAPVAAIGRSLEAKVSWDEKTQSVTIQKDEKIIILKIASPKARINNNIYTVDVTPQIINGRAMVPVSFIAKAFEEAVEWDGSNKTVYIGHNSHTLSRKYLVTRVVDGDTIEIEYNGSKEKVRLIGIDAPESVHPNASKNVEFGKVATAFTKEALENKEVALEFDVSQRDRYGRLLAYVWIDGIMFNKTLVETGMALVSTYPPDVKYAEQFVKLQEQARQNKVGLWVK